MFSLAELQPLLHRTWVPLWYLLLCLSECSVLWISRFLYIPGSHLDNSYLQREVYLGDVIMTGGHYWHLPSRAWDAECSVVCGTVLHNEELSYSNASNTPFEKHCCDLGCLVLLDADTVRAGRGSGWVGGACGMGVRVSGNKKMFLLVIYSPSLAWKSNLPCHLSAESPWQSCGSIPC